MPVPFQVTFLNIDPSLAIRQRVAERVDKLERMYPRAVSCKVVIRAPHRHHRTGRLFEVRIDLKLPGDEIAVTRTPAKNEDAYVAIHDAFDALERRLDETVRRRRGDVKSHVAA